MQRWTFIILCLTWLPFSCGTNPKQTVSEPQLHAATKDHGLSIQTADTADINQLFRKAKLMNYSDSAKALYLRALFESKFINYEQGVVYAYLNLAYYNKLKGNFSKADTCYTKGVNYMKVAIPRAIKREEPQLTRRLYTLLLRFAHELHAYNDVIEFYRLAEGHFVETDSVQQLELLKMKLYLGEAYYSLSHYDSSYNTYAGVLPAIQKPDSTNYTLLGYSHLGMGCIQGKMGLGNEAVAHFVQASAIAQQFDDTIISLRALDLLSNYYLARRDYHNTKKYASRALDKAKRTANGIIKLPSLFNATSNLASAYLMEDSLEDAQAYSTMAHDYALQMQDKVHGISANYLKGGIYIAFNRPDSAIQVLSAGFRDAKDMNRTGDIAALSGRLGEAYAAAGNHKIAYDFVLKYATLKDSLQGSENAMRVAQINNRFKAAEQSKLLAQSQLQIAKQELKIKNQYILVAALSAGACLIILILSLILRRRKHRSQLETLKARLAGEEEERGRLARELHDGIVSQLSIIKTNLCTLPASNRNPEEQQHFLEVIAQLDQGIAELRRTSHNLLPDIIKQAGLFGALEFYCRKITQSGVLDIEFQPVGALPDLEKPFQLNIYRIVQELVSNIIKHAQATTALMQVAVREETLEITIDDNGSHAYEASGISPGIGLQNLQSRLKLTGGTIEIERNGGTSVYLSFDLRNFIVPVA